jgi:PDZ domain-containing protein
VGEEVAVTVWREGKEQVLRATSRHIARLENRRNRYGVAPRYVVYAGLVFMPLDTELLKVWGRAWINTADRNLVWHHLFREAEDPDSADREVVVLTRVLRHAANSQLNFSGPVAVDKINDVPIRSLADVVKAFEGNHGRFHRLDFEGMTGIEVLDREKADAAHAAILKQYAIRADRNL